MEQFEIELEANFVVFNRIHPDFKKYIETPKTLRDLESLGPKVC